MKATDELLKQIKELNIEDFKKQESFDGNIPKFV